MLQLTSRGNYGILAMYYIAQDHRDEYISIDEIAERSQIPKPYLGKILQDLCRGGILVSRRGTGGGFALSRAPEAISLREVIEVIEGKIYLVHCLLNSAKCGQSKTCPVSPIWGEVQKIVIEIIASITLDDLVNPAKKQNMLAFLETCQTMYRQKVERARSGEN